MRKRIYSLDYIRVLAMFMIIVFHWNVFCMSVDVQTDPIFLMYFKTSNIAHLGVSLFFILSGASLQYTYKKNKLKTYYKKRFLAIYPLFWVMYVFFFTNIYIVRRSPLNVDKSSFILSFLGMDGFLNYKMSTVYLIGEWFLGCIILIYLLFPLLHWCVEKFPRITVIATTIFFVLWVNFYSFQMPISHCPITRIPEVLFGMYFIKIFYNEKRIEDGNYGCSPVVGIVSLIFFAIPALFQINLSISYIILWMGFSCFLVFAWMFRFLEKKEYAINHWISLLSNYSYAIFLAHHVIMCDYINYYSGVKMSPLKNYVMFAYYFVCLMILSVSLKKITDFGIKNILRIK